MKEYENCTFTPEISKPKIDYVVNNLVNKKEEKMAKKYYERVNKAKMLKEEIKTKLNPDYSKKIIIFIII